MNNDISMTKVKRLITNRQSEINNKIDALKSDMASLSNNPEKIFEKYGLTINRILADEISGSGYKTNFSYLGNIYPRPELVAKAFYESQGFKVSWSEGVAWELAIQRLLDELTEHCPKYLKVIEGDFIRKINSSADPSSPEYRDLMQNLLESKKRHESDIESSGIISRSTLLRYISAAMDDNKDELKELHEIKCNHSGDYTIILSEPLEDFREDIKNAISSLCSTKDKAGIISKLPKPPTERKSNFSADRNLNEWSILFAKELLESLDWAKLLNTYFQKSYYILNPFDLTVVNTTTSEVKFVEVKFKDKFTSKQIDYLAGAIACGIPVELFVIRG